MSFFSPPTELLRIRNELLTALSKEHEKRLTNKNWENDEHLLMQRVATKAAYCQVSLDEIKKAEQTALGHTDYSSKFCLRVAELTIEKRREAFV